MFDLATPQVEGERLGDLEGLVETAIEASQSVRFARTIRPSEIGHPCARLLWLKFRWMFAPERFAANSLRIFGRGQREEDRIIADLASAGLSVVSRDPTTGRQWEMVALDGHMKGFADALAYGLPRDPMTCHTLEAKSHNRASFADLEKNGVCVSKPLHYAQMMLYAHRFGTPYALYAAVNKDNNRYGYWRFPANDEYAKALLSRADAIRWSSTPPPRLPRAPKNPHCRECSAQSVCLGIMKPLVNCRSCRHSVAADGGWRCAMKDIAIDADLMLTGCSDHSMIANLAE